MSVMKLVSQWRLRGLSSPRAHLLAARLACVARMLAAAFTSALAVSAPMLALRGTEASAAAAAAAAASSVLLLAEEGKDAEPVRSPVEGAEK